MSATKHNHSKFAQTTANICARLRCSQFCAFAEITQFIDFIYEVSKRMTGLKERLEGTPVVILSKQECPDIEAVKEYCMKSGWFNLNIYAVSRRLFKNSLPDIKPLFSTLLSFKAN